MEKGKTYYIHFYAANFYLEPPEVGRLNLAKMAKSNPVKILSFCDSDSLIKRLQSSGKAGVIMVSNENSFSFIMEGDMGLLDMSINTAFAADLKENVENINLENLKYEFIFKPLEKKLQEIGWKIEHIDSINSEALLPKTIFDADSHLEPPFDLKDIAKTNNFDIIILVSIVDTILSRAYWGFIPTGTPAANVMLSAYFVDGYTNRLISQFNIQYISKTDKDWNINNSYIKVVDACKDSFMTAAKLLIEKIPMP